MKNEWKLQPQDIENKSFAIIDQEAGSHHWSPDEWSIVRRMVHTSADFDYVKDSIISPGAIAAGIAALKRGAPIITDTKMALCGISQARLTAYNNRVISLISDERTMRKAREAGTTRALAAVDLAHDLFFKSTEEGGIWVIGNAPTALLRLLEKMADEPNWPRPSLIVGLPVGFVNAREAKEYLHQHNQGLNYITNLSRKGGSNVAASVINALAELANGTK